MELQTFTCPNCGKSLEANPNLDTIMCNACGTSFTPDMSTGKLAIHKISGIINKAMDQHQENKIRKEELRIERERENFKQVMIYFGIMIAVPIVYWILTSIF